MKPSPWALGGAPRTITLLSAVVGEMVCLMHPQLTVNVMSPMLFCRYGIAMNDLLGALADMHFVAYI